MMMIRPILAMALVAALGACNNQPTEEPAAEASASAEPAPVETAAAPAPESGETAATAPMSEPPFAVKEGDRVKVTKQANASRLPIPRHRPGRCSKA